MRRWIGLFCLLSGCTADKKTVLPLPNVGDAKTLVVAFSLSEKMQTVIAETRNDTFEINLQTNFDASETALVELLAYTSSAADLGIPLGEVHFFQDGEPLPKSSAFYRTTIVAGNPTEWTAAEPSILLSSFRFRRLSPCVEFVSERIDLPLTNHLQWGIELSASEALIGARDQVVWVHDGAVEEIELVPPAWILSATRDEKDQLWLGGEGRIYRGHFDGRLHLEEVLTSSSGRWINALIVRGTEDIYTLTQTDDLEQDDQCVERFDGAWHEIYCFPPGDEAGALAPLEPERIIAVDDDLLGIVEIRGNQAQWVPWPLDFDSGGPAKAVFTPSFGTVISTRNGKMITSKDGGWSQLIDGTFGSGRIHAITEYEGVLVWGDGAGYLWHYVNGFGVCPERNLSQTFSQGIVLSQDGGLLMSGFADEPFLTSVHRAR